MSLPPPMPIDTLNEPRTRELVASVASRPYGYGLPHHAPPAPTPLNSSIVAESVVASEAITENRRALFENLRGAEVDEMHAAEQRASDEHNTAEKLAAEREQTQRAADAEAIAARAAEEHRLRLAEFNAAKARLAEAEQALNHAAAASDRAEAARQIEAKAAAERSAEARQAESALMNSRATEDKAVTKRHAVAGSAYHAGVPVGPVAGAYGVHGAPLQGPLGHGAYTRYGYGSRYLH